MKSLFLASLAFLASFQLVGAFELNSNDSLQRFYLNE